MFWPFPHNRRQTSDRPAQAAARTPLACPPHAPRGGHSAGRRAAAPRPLPPSMAAGPAGIRGASIPASHRRSLARRPTRRVITRCCRCFLRREPWSVGAQLEAWSLSLPAVRTRRRAVPLKRGKGAPGGPQSKVGHRRAGSTPHAALLRGSSNPVNPGLAAHHPDRTPCRLRARDVGVA